MNEKQAARWSVTRQTGKVNYVKTRGLLLVGLGLTLLFTAVEWAMQGRISPFWVLVRLIVFSFAGVLAAGYRWDSRERKYQNAGRTREAGSS